MIRVGVLPASVVTEDRVISTMNQSDRVRITDRKGSYFVFKKGQVDHRPIYFNNMEVGDVIECFDDTCDEPPNYVKLKVSEPDGTGLPFSYQIQEVH